MQNPKIYTSICAIFCVEIGLPSWFLITLYNVNILDFEALCFVAVLFPIDARFQMEFATCKNDVIGGLNF
jgi:hypothetical protein